MEKEFLELIKTFEKAGARLETLDTTILGFKEIVEDLRNNLDELVEMVQLEQIVELSMQSITKLKKLGDHLNELENHQERTVASLENQIHVLGQVIKGETETVANGYLYQVDEETKEIKVISLGEPKKKQVIKGLQVKKLLSHHEEAFALNLDGTTLYALNGENLVPILHKQITDFVVCDYQVYFLSEKQLLKYHLLNREQSIILSDVVNIALLKDGKHLLCEIENQEMTVFKLR